MISRTGRPRQAVLLAIVAAGMLPVAAAQAFADDLPYAGPAPLYPYAAPGPPARAPNGHAVRYRLRAHPYVHCLDGCAGAPVAQRRTRGGANRAAVAGTEPAHDAAAIIVTRGAVVDPPHVIEATPVPLGGQQVGGDARASGGGKPRVIHADAEVTIIEPDRMIIRLLRKPPGPQDTAPAGE
jgi:hypothetical protein